MTAIFIFLAAILLYFSWLSMTSGLKYLRYFRQEMARPIPVANLFCSVIVPCKGLDHELEENLKAVIFQNHPQFEVIFVVESEKDPALEILNDLTRVHANAKLVVAEISKNTGQKVANLIEAVKHIHERSEVLAFADSDARPTENWLRYLTDQLTDETIGMTTGYRWFTPLDRSPSADILSVWNASIASSLGQGKNIFCWGGSMAIRRDRFEKLDVAKRWRGTVSDDFVLSKIMSDAALQIVFIPQALIPGIGQPKFREVLEFTTRQIKLTRVYSPKMWRMLFLGSGLHVFMLGWATVVLAFGQSGTLIYRSSLFLLFGVGILGTIKAILRLKAISLVSPELEKAARDQKRVQITLWVVTPLLFFYNCLVSAFSRKIVWRGVAYNMVSDKQTEMERVES